MRKYKKMSKLINNTGYTPGASSESNPVNYIPSEDITMRNTPYPLYGQPLDQFGNAIGSPTYMEPGQDYNFEGASYVAETPAYKNGGMKQDWISEKIGELIKEGRPQKQAVAIAYSMWNQKHEMGGTQLPMYQFAGTAELDQYGQPLPKTSPAPTPNWYQNNPAGMQTNFGQLPTQEPKPDYNKMYMGMSTADEKLTPPIDYNKMYMSMSTEEEQLKPINDGGASARTTTGITQFYNPYGGVGIGDALSFSGQQFANGNKGLGIAGAAAGVLEGTKAFLSGMSGQKRQNQVMKNYAEEQRKNMTGEGREVVMAYGGYYQDGGMDKSNYEEEVNADMDRSYPEITAQNNPVFANQNMEAPVVTEEKTNANFDANSARDNWVQKTGLPWSEAKRLGYTDGTAKDNIKLLSELKDPRFKIENLRKAPVTRKAVDNNKTKKTYTQEELWGKPLVNPIEDYISDLRKGSPVKTKGDASRKKPLQNTSYTSPFTNAPRQTSPTDPFGLSQPMFQFQEGGMQPEMAEEQMMMDNPQQPGGDQMQAIAQEVAGMLQQGADPQEILQQLVQAGLPEEQAMQVIQMVMEQMQGGQTQATPQLGYGGEMMDYMKNGGNHGGLDRWFEEEWVDIKTGKPCGRQKGESRDGYPACRPSKRVSEDTPKTASELSSSEKDKFKRSKNSSERISYQHNRKEDGGLIEEDNMYMKDGGNVPTNPELWGRAKSAARAKYDVYPSAYANGFASKWYKQRGGGWRKKAEAGGCFECGGEYEDGGYMYAEGGTNNEGFKALPEYVQENILSNMRVGGEYGIDFEFNNGGYYRDGGEPQNAGFQALPKDVKAKILASMEDGGMYDMEEYAEGGTIPDRYKNAGFTKVGAKKQSTRPGKKWMVLAKKGDQYKIVHGGDDSMKDFSQHGSKDRKENFWNRMGGRNSAKANDPFSPLYWHKRFGTWQEGGEIEGDEEEMMQSENPQQEQIEDQVAAALQQGADPQEILQQLVQMGMPEQEAIQMIQYIMQELQGEESEMEEPDEEQEMMKNGGEYLAALKGKKIKNYTYNKNTGNYDVELE